MGVAEDRGANFSEVCVNVESQKQYHGTSIAAWKACDRDSTSNSSSD